MDIKEKLTLSSNDIQTIMGCGKNNVYILINKAIRDKLFIVKQIGKKYYIPADSFWKWFNTNNV